MSHAVLVHPIHTDADLATTLERIDTLWGATPGSHDGDELDVLLALVEAYENRHHAIPTASGVALLRDLMTTHGLTQRDLPEIGAQSVVSAILAGKRRINARMAKALAARFAMRADAFLI